MRLLLHTTCGPEVYGGILMPAPSTAPAPCCGGMARGTRHFLGDRGFPSPFQSWMVAFSLLCGLRTCGLLPSLPVPGAYRYVAVVTYTPTCPSLAEGGVLAGRVMWNRAWYILAFVLLGRSLPRFTRCSLYCISCCTACHHPPLPLLSVPGVASCACMLLGGSPYR